MEIYQTKNYVLESPPPVPGQLDSSLSASPAGTWNSRIQHSNMREADRARVRHDGHNSGKHLNLSFHFDPFTSVLLHFHFYYGHKFILYHLVI